MAKTNFSSSWKGSVQPRKQRKYLYNAPLHIRQRMLRVHLSPELRKKYALRAVRAIKGDKIKVLRGKFRKKEGKIDSVNIKKELIFVSGLEVIKKDGTKFPAGLPPSNLMIVALNMESKGRVIGSKNRVVGSKKSRKNGSKNENKKSEAKKNEAKNEGKEGEGTAKGHY
ncbi:MAG: 50S ribosomal protein L24 [Nanoarchaeota archaeon]